MRNTAYCPRISNKWQEILFILSTGINCAFFSGKTKPISLTNRGMSLRSHCGFRDLKSSSCGGVRYIGVHPHHNLDNDAMDDVVVI